METFLIRLLQFILAISLLVLLHEGGHMFFAKLFGVRVKVRITEYVKNEAGELKSSLFSSMLASGNGRESSSVGNQRKMIQSTEWDGYL